ncbi:hypothetical protein TRFO_11800 [Tritrichomonas foetus]|uniref:Uncharacterized protein n=1 Tax=Tritrichomonas foetus TaxID=1144522 RepID=A0A1J4J6W2_9EUKA|nr:hypothetical protein TRFO_11800 [Tritrichomonas foetus]|eukprot:OHS93395.1 hypothetical protein TRFO_11800 [Tritrichomonas foetus]
MHKRAITNHPVFLFCSRKMIGINYKETNSQFCQENLPKFPTPDEFNCYEDFRKSAFKWSEEIRMKLTPKLIFPIPVSLFYHYFNFHRKMPKIKSDHLKSKDKRSDLKMFKLSAKNELQLFRKIIDGEKNLLDRKNEEVFCETDRNWKPLKISHFVTNNELSTLVPFEPLPKMYANFEDFFQAEQKWKNLSIELINQTYLGQEHISIESEREYNENPDRNQSSNNEKKNQTSFLQNEHERNITKQVLFLKDPEEVGKELGLTLSTPKKVKKIKTYNDFDIPSSKLFLPKEALDDVNKYSKLEKPKKLDEISLKLQLFQNFTSDKIFTKIKVPKIANKNDPKAESEQEKFIFEASEFGPTTEKAKFILSTQNKGVHSRKFEIFPLFILNNELINDFIDFCNEKQISFSSLIKPEDIHQFLIKCDISDSNMSKKFSFILKSLVQLRNGIKYLEVILENQSTLKLFLQINESAGEIDNFPKIFIDEFPIPKNHEFYELFYLLIECGRLFILKDLFSIKRWNLFSLANYITHELFLLIQNSIFLINHNRDKIIFNYTKNMPPLTPRKTSIGLKRVPSILLYKNILIEDEINGAKNDGNNKESNDKDNINSDNNHNNNEQHAIISQNSSVNIESFNIEEPKKDAQYNNYVFTLRDDSHISSKIYTNRCATINSIGSLRFDADSDITRELDFTLSKIEPPSNFNQLEDNSLFLESQSNKRGSSSEESKIPNKGNSFHDKILFFEKLNQQTNSTNKIVSHNKKVEQEIDIGGDDNLNESKNIKKDSKNHHKKKKKKSLNISINSDLNPMEMLIDNGISYFIIFMILYIDSSQLHFSLFNDQSPIEFFNTLSSVYCVKTERLKTLFIISKAISNTLSTILNFDIVNLNITCVRFTLRVLNYIKAFNEKLVSQNQVLKILKMSGSNRMPSFCFALIPSLASIFANKKVMLLYINNPRELQKWEYDKFIITLLLGSLTQDASSSFLPCLFRSIEILLNSPNVIFDTTFWAKFCGAISVGESNSWLLLKKIMKRGYLEMLPDYFFGFLPIVFQSKRGTFVLMLRYFSKVVETSCESSLQYIEGSLTDPKYNIKSILKKALKNKKDFNESNLIKLKSYYRKICVKLNIYERRFQRLHSLFDF